jgi:hypothetical protein
MARTQDLFGEQCAVLAPSGFYYEMGKTRLKQLVRMKLYQLVY